MSAAAMPSSSQPVALRGRRAETRPPTRQTRMIGMGTTRSDTCSPRRGATASKAIVATAAATAPAVTVQAIAPAVRDFTRSMVPWAPGRQPTRTTRCASLDHERALHAALLVDETDELVGAGRRVERDAAVAPDGHIQVHVELADGERVPEQ